MTSSSFPAASYIGRSHIIRIEAQPHHQGTINQASGELSSDTRNLDLCHGSSRLTQQRDMPWCGSLGEQ